MKYISLLLFAVFLGLAASQPQGTTVLTGKVTDDAGEPLIGATVVALQDTVFVRGTITDYNGEYRLVLGPGTYNVKVSYTGYKTALITGVRVVGNTINTADVQLASGNVLSEVTVTAFKVPPIEQDKIQGGQALTSDELKTMPTRSVNAITATTAGTTSTDGRDVKIKGSRSEAANYYIDGVRVAGKPAEMPPPKPGAALLAKAKKAAPERDAYARPEVYHYLDGDKESDVAYKHADDVLSKVSTAAKAEETPAPATDPGLIEPPAPHSGLLTAGEWNDLHNWSHHWLDLLHDGETDAFQQQYRFFPKNRYSVLLQNNDELPVADAVVQLADRSGKLLWEARTDNTGRAELWAGLYGETSAESLVLTAWVDGKKHPLGAARPFSEGLNRLHLQRECPHAANLDIVWTVDATGSMGDELEYLKTELLDVIGRVKAANPNLNVRMGSVFYRDQGDDYVVRSSALKTNIAETVTYIREQSAEGGGDYPEAVHSALEEAVSGMAWSPEAVARICFLVLDASPHNDPAVVESLHKSIREAARKGIRIVPVSASGIQKDTEFLLKFFGLATNGTYVFLTDHSGIGGKHLEPTTDEYKVEQLNDLLVRLITEYTALPTCDGKSTIRFDDALTAAGQLPPSQQGRPLLEPVRYFPNPASQYCTLELPFDADKVTLYDAEGKAVRSLNQLPAGSHTLPVQDLAPGFYTLRIWKGGQVQSGKLVVVRE